MMIMCRTIQFIAACILLLGPINSSSADKITQHTEGNQSPALNIAPGGKSIINYYNVDPKYEKLLLKKDEELKKAKKTIQEQRKELKKYANRIKEISNLIATEKIKPDANIEKANKAENLLQAGKLDEAKKVIVTLTSAVAHVNIGRLSIYSGVKVKNNQCAQAIGDKKLIICIESIEHADNPSRLVVHETVEAPGEENLQRLIVGEGSCTHYSGYYIRVSSISSESADFTITKDEPCE